ncbi:hypothetical protein CHU98_g7255 [Xylaria longipes]|nr:hypothetical protein CHU98_g7255 [Xylaria longipes]
MYRYSLEGTQKYNKHVNRHNKVPSKRAIYLAALGVFEIMTQSVVYALIGSPVLVQVQHSSGIQATLLHRVAVVRTKHE